MVVVLSLSGTKTKVPQKKRTPQQSQGENGEQGDAREH
jgi:hypothetical protein